MKRYSPYSELKIFCHTDRLEGLLQEKRVAPIYIRIKPTNICNQNCFYCGYAGNRLYEGREVDRRDSIPWKYLERAIYDMAEIGVKAVTFSGGGEPLCYHSIDKALTLIQQLELDYSMITNGQVLEGDYARLLRDAKWIRVSFDSDNTATYQRSRNVATYHKVLKNIEQFANIKSENCALGINCVITKQNAEEIYGICKLAKQLGAENIKLSPIMVKENEGSYHKDIQDLVSDQIVRAKEEFEDKSFQIVDKYTHDISMNDHFRKEYHRCLIQEFFAVIAADSKVYRCHQKAYMPVGVIGDLNKESFKDIWYGEETVKGAREFDARKECQFRCAFDERNILLNSLLDIDKNHINFI